MDAEWFAGARPKRKQRSDKGSLKRKATDGRFDEMPQYVDMGDLDYIGGNPAVDDPPKLPGCPWRMFFECWVRGSEARGRHAHGLARSKHANKSGGDGRGRDVIIGPCPLAEAPGQQPLADEGSSSSSRLASR